MYITFGTTEVSCLFQIFCACNICEDVEDKVPEAVTSGEGAAAMILSPKEDQILLGNCTHIPFYLIAQVHEYGKWKLGFLFFLFFNFFSEKKFSDRGNKIGR